MSTPVSTPHIRGHSRNSFPDDRHNPRLSFSALRRTIRRAELPAFGLSCLCCSSRGVTVSGVSPLHGASPAAAQSRSLWEWCPGGIPRRHLYRPAAFVLLLHERLTPVMIGCGFADVRDCQPAVSGKYPVHPVHPCESIIYSCLTLNRFPATRLRGVFQVGLAPGQDNPTLPIFRVAELPRHPNHLHIPC